MGTDIDLAATAQRVSALLPAGRAGVLFSGGMDSGVLLGLLARARGPEGTAALHALNTLAEGWEEEAARTSAGSATYASRQPRLPQSHAGPCGSITVWPNSPPPPRVPR